MLALKEAALRKKKDEIDDLDQIPVEEIYSHIQKEGHNLKTGFKTEGFYSEARKICEHAFILKEGQVEYIIDQNVLTSNPNCSILIKRLIQVYIET